MRNFIATFTFIIYNVMQCNINVLALLNFLELSVVVAAEGTITTAPENAIGLRTDENTLLCVASTSVEWVRDNNGVTDDTCQPLHSDYSTTQGSTSTDCTLIVQGTSSTILSGPFTCFDGTENAEATVIVIGQCTKFYQFSAVCI